MAQHFRRPPVPPRRSPLREGHDTSGAHSADRASPGSPPGMAADGVRLAYATSGLLCAGRHRPAAWPWPGAPQGGLFERLGSRAVAGAGL